MSEIRLQTTRFSSPSSTFFNNHQDHHSHYHHTDYHHHRSASPTHINLYTSSTLSLAFRFSIEHYSISPNRSVTTSKKNGPIAAARKMCMCSPTNHPNLFRCRSAMTNSLVRISGVEGEWVKRAFTALFVLLRTSRGRELGFSIFPILDSSESTPSSHE
ncbi:hypothetical protein RchiOBHm_Chr1g0364551 [Rosa chinensis]|uniref:Uncharacterized protein n=1 Tax=Rosa chinensis TaxID=74649 RepID=A0A2P6SJT7_ROSCH|nr:hypothetical protein RchiOBHm_Chr1g0364551 [Rosa chinensis]